jgi:hypothetical protein
MIVLFVNDNEQKPCQPKQIQKNINILLISLYFLDKPGQVNGAAPSCLCRDMPQMAVP